MWNANKEVVLLVYLLFQNSYYFSYFSLNAIISDISDEDLRWVTDKIHYYLLRLLDDVEYDSDEEESIQLLENSLR